MHDAGPPIPLPLILFLGAAVFAPPIFNRLGLGAVVGYLVAGVLLGPTGFSIFSDPHQTLRIAELGVVLLLFIIGLEMELSRLHAIRNDLFTLGLVQILLSTAALGGIAWAIGFQPVSASLIGFALSLSSTALTTRLLDERGDLNRRYGQRTLAALIMQDLAVVPVLALVPALADGAGQAIRLVDIATNLGIAVLSLAGIVLAGRYLIDPLLRRLTHTGTQEVMIAAALLLVFGAAEISDAVGLSMALGAFLAGLLLARSSYRHELKADVEPFRSLLLAFFFMSVGMSLDVRGVFDNWELLAVSLVGLFAVKAVIAAGTAQLTGSSTAQAWKIGAFLAPASEFSFVLLPLLSQFNVISDSNANFLMALGILSMVFGAPFAKLTIELARRCQAQPEIPNQDYENVHGTVLVIGFGRFGQVAAQLLLAEGIETVLIDNSGERIRQAARFGFKVWYGDGTRLDVLRAAGAAGASLILVCIEGQDLSLRVVDLIRDEFPNAKIMVRAQTREHAIELMNRGVDFQIRETFESAMVFGREALHALGYSKESSAEVEEDVRRRDEERLEIQRAEGLDAGVRLLHEKRLLPEPLRRAKRGVALNPEAAEAIEKKAEQGA